MSTKNDPLFVQIPSYRDSQLVATLDSLLCNAYNKERLHISICWQHGALEKLPKRIITLRNIHIIDICHTESKGANWARSIVQKNYNSEPYSLLIDSHTRFVKQWDKKLIDMMLTLKKKTNKPLITGYPPPFDPRYFPKKKSYYPLKMYVEGYHFNLLTKFNGVKIPLYKWLTEPISAQFLALGFLFTEGSFNTEIPFDPNIYFYGDEITTGLRSYCHGYDFYHPNRVVAWHLYDRQTRVPHWDNHSAWEKLDIQSFKRISAIFNGKNFSKFPLGNKRTIGDYEKFIGYKLIQDDLQGKS